MMYINDEEYDGAEGFSLSKALNSYYISASVTVTVSPESTNNPFKRWAKARILIGDTEMINGYVSDYSMRVSARGARTGTIKIVSPGIDLTQSSVDIESNQVKGLTYIDIIAKIVDKFKIKLDTEKNRESEVAENFKIRDGSKASEVINNGLRMQKRQIKPTARGIKIYSADNFPRRGKINENDYTGGGASVRSASLFSRYTFKSNSSQTSTGDNTLKVVIDNDSVSRFRPITIKVDGKWTEGELREYGKWHIARAHALGTTANLSFAGFRYGHALNLFDVGEIFTIHAPNDLKLSNYDMVVTQVSFKQDVRSGTSCSLSLVGADAYRAFERKKTVPKRLKNQQKGEWQIALGS